jgi:hypothetical protein
MAPTRLTPRQFRKYVRPTSENHRIPQLEAPDATVVRDTTAIFDILEAQHLTAFPYFFGGLASIADHVLMGCLLGHLARDPESSRLM